MVAKKGAQCLFFQLTPRVGICLIRNRPFSHFLSVSHVPTNRELDLFNVNSRYTWFQDKYFNCLGVRWDQIHDLGIGSTMLNQLSYRNTFMPIQDFQRHFVIELCLPTGCCNQAKMCRQHMFLSRQGQTLLSRCKRCSERHR